jgi:hypothetical protein
VNCEARKRLKLRPNNDPSGGRAGSARDCRRARDLPPTDEHAACGPPGVPDESGVTTKMAPTRARVPRGQRAYDSIPLGSWQRLTVLGTLACEGLTTTMSIKASTSVLLAYLEPVLVPKLRQIKPDAILVMDNVRPHHAKEVRELLDRAGIGLLYLPLYSPEFNPISFDRLTMRRPGPRSKSGSRRKPPALPRP